MQHTIYHFFSRFLSVHESLGNDSWGEDLVALAELLKEDPVGEPETTDPDPLQHTVAAQLVQHKGSSYLAGLRARRGGGGNTCET